MIYILYFSSSVAKQYEVCVDFEREHTVTCIIGKKLLNHFRDQLRELSSVNGHSRLFFSAGRHNALAACMGHL